MGTRLNKIMTRTGDQGTTGLANNVRVAKYHTRIEALGEVDELNSHIGRCLCENMPQCVSQMLKIIQHAIFDIGSELALPGYTAIQEQHIQQLEHWLEQLNAELPPLKEFVLPGGSLAASQLHLCRTVARRAERRVCATHHEKELSPLVLQYLNRLSDLFFVAARYVNQHEGVDEMYWQSERLRAIEQKPL